MNHSSWNGTNNDLIPLPPLFTSNALSIFHSSVHINLHTFITLMTTNVWRNEYCSMLILSTRAPGFLKPPNNEDTFLCEIISFVSMSSCCNKRRKRMKASRYTSGIEEIKTRMERATMATDKWWSGREELSQF